MLRAADLFCGAGGTSSGAEATGGVRVHYACNHWDKAIGTHSANFPHTKHFHCRIDQVDPRECDKIDLLFASPECTHHSRARGGRPTSDQQRAGAWCIMPWIEYHRPRWVIVENVVEFREWGPVDDLTGRPLKSRRGAFFDAWLKMFWAAGYRVDVQVLNAADFGAATSRSRLFVIARKGNRNPVFPEPTHGQHTRGALPGMGLSPWRPAAEIIDWSIPCPSIFNRKRPLADKTLLRIEAGLRRFVGPFVAQWDNHGGNGHYVRDVDGPLGTQTTKANSGLVMPYQVVFRNNMDSADLSDPLSTITAGGGHHGVAIPFLSDVNHGNSGHSNGRSHSVDAPLGTVTARNGKAIVTPFVLATGSGGAPRGIDSPVPTIVTRDGSAFVTPFLCGCGGRAGQSPPRPIDGPTGTITTKADQCVAVPYQFQLIGRGAGKSRGIDQAVPTILAARENHGVIIPWLAHYYGTDNQSPMTDPVDTITTKERHSLCMALCRGPQDWPTPHSEAMRVLQATMLQLGVCDIGFRMLSNPELAAAQGFNADYKFHGTKAEITRQIGNSVSPSVAQAMTQAILSV